MMFAITLWWLWKWRNTEIFGRNEEIPIDPIRFLHTKLKEMSDALLKDDMRKQGCYKIRKEVFIGWITPPDGWVMLNTDGASRGNLGDAGGGGILRDDRGHFIRAFAENYGICTVTISELLAFMRGITMARDMGIKKLFVKVDSQVVVQFME
ncbi:LURP1-like domain-containing protein [Tanacetum coccineum]|uniref:LURP1-like domain-containing protein n=1 Tax=Tanacetum coccineum TaxID=301880 RepID=A0ABQ4ZAN2_9ASTR